MKDDYKLLEIIHNNKNLDYKFGIMLDKNKYNFLEELYEQYNEFTIIKDANGNLKLITKL